MNSVEANGCSLRAVLNRLNLIEYADLLESQDLDLEVLAEVNEKQLEKIGVKTLGQRTRFLQAAKDASRVGQRCIIFLFQITFVVCASNLGQ